MDMNSILERLRTTLWIVPEKRFDDMVKDNNYTDSFIYLLICMALSIPIMILGYIVIALANNASLSSAASAVVLSLPAVFLIGIPLQYIGFGVEFALLKILGGKGDFQKSVQVFVYAGTPSFIFGSLPYIGILPSLLGLYNIVVGSARLHQMSLWKAVIAIVVIPIIIAIVIIFALAAILGPAAAGLAAAP